ncbi:putative phospholipid-transporting ATPase 1-like protein [Trypanosoma rangeli]|uniref:Putative phospholipid-transporting ATPase 1-like protein n=1 Tax=Trypanosoma rangeli TaxID=5698 RepID=A0A422NRR2_TRYRA|nr:putative phospholipid-transporting ATPase 1-like protein [Trypanosoma rangeli]RNF08175.1 putative phospholipid-transporting ATPase 1-like protein [Trypanosoma rangeli]|eukprot:RNF08175.1 putative phospholipid-transporting ATPase 1-like protein [Trypanosoma rangeli]
MFTGLWLVLLGLFRSVVEVLLFMPRYLLLERHDRRSPMWGVRAEAVVCFGSTFCLDVLSCIECLDCLGGATHVFASPMYQNSSTNTAAASDEHEAATDEDMLNSLSISSPLSPQQALLEVDGNGSEASTEQSCEDAWTAASAMMMNAFSRCLHRTSTRFTPEQKLRCGEDAMAAAVSTAAGAHILHGVFTGGIPFVQYSLLQNACVEADAHEAHNERHETHHLRGSCQRKPLLRGRDYGTFSCWFPGDTAGAESTHVPYRTYPRQPRVKKGFIPPWYAVTSKAQLLLSFLDPLWRIVTGLFFMSHGGEVQHRYAGGARRRFRRVSLTSTSSVSCMFTKLQPRRGQIPDPVEEICFIPEQAAKALWACAHAPRQGTLDEAPTSCNYVPTLAPMKSSMRRGLAASPEGPQHVGVVEYDASPSSRKCAKIKPETLSACHKEMATEEHDRAHTATAGCAWESRVTSLHWLHGSAPPEASDSSAPVIVLLLCPSVAQGNEHGYVARRLGALCEALTTMSKLRRQRSCNSRRLQPSQTQLEKDMPDTSTTSAETTDPHFASWHAAIPVAELIGCSCGMPFDDAAGADASLCRRRVNVTVEDIDRVLSRLGRLRTASRHSFHEQTAARNKPPSWDAEAVGGAPTPSNSHSDVHLQNDPKAGTRSLYIVGVGWSNASSPLLQYVMSYGAESRLDGVICINHSASSNYALVPETVSNSSKQPQSFGWDRLWCSRKHKTPFHSNFLSAPAGAVRLLLLAARLHLTADRLSELWRQQQKKKTGNVVQDVHDVAIWEYLYHTVGIGTSGNSKIERGDDTSLPPAYSCAFPFFSRPLLTPEKAPLGVLQQVEAQVEQEMGRWWLNEVQAGNEDDEDCMRSRGIPSWGDSVAHFSSSGRWHPLMSLSDWEVLLQSCDDTAATTLMDLGLPGRCVLPHFSTALPSPPHDASRDTLHVEDAEDSRCRKDGDAEPAQTTATTRAAGGVPGGHRATPPQSPAHCASRLFEMARGRPDHLLPAHLSSPRAQGSGDASRKTAAARKVKRDAYARPSPPPNLAMVALRYHSASSAHLVSLIRIPTLFVHASDDEMAPLNTLPMRALSKNPCVVTVLTRRGGHGVFLEGISTLHALPQLTLQERELAIETNKASNGGASCMPSRTRQWLPPWRRRAGGKYGPAPATAARSSCSVPFIDSAKSNNNNTMTEVTSTVETVFVVEHTTWLERLIVEFVAAAVIV